MKFKHYSLSLFLALSSSLIFAGGGEGTYTREIYFKRFINPNLLIQAELNKKLLADILSESDWYDPYDWHPSIDLNGQKFSDYINNALIENGRNSISIASTLFDKKSWSKCKGNEARNGVVNLLKAIAVDTSLSDQEVKKIIDRRYKTAENCSINEDNFNNLDWSVGSSLPVDWRDYLTGLFWWYKSDLKTAALSFEEVLKSAPESSTVYQLAEYMAGRSYLVAAQIEWKPWIDKQGLETEDLIKAKKLLSAHYQNAHIYADSAYGLIGRIDYLLEDQDVYSSNLESRLDLAITQKNQERFSQIIREYLLTEKLEQLNTLLLQKSDESPKLFSDSPFSEFVTFLQAYNEYQTGDIKHAINLFRQTNYSASFNYLVKYAQETNNLELELEAITKYLEGNTKALYLAEIGYREKGISSLLQTGNIVLTQGVAMSYCNRAQLEEDIRENLNAPHIIEAQKILYRSLVQNQDFRRLNKLFNEEGFKLDDFNLIRTAVKQVATNQNLGKAYMNVGYFMEAKQGQLPSSGIDGYLAERHPEVFCRDGLRDNIRGPQFVYKLAIENFNNNENSMDEAKALSFMVNCDRLGKKGCWGNRPEDAESSKVMFQRLHKKYGDSRWAKATPYYY